MMVIDAVHSLLPVTPPDCWLGQRYSVLSQRQEKAHFDPVALASCDKE